RSIARQTPSRIGARTFLTSLTPVVGYGTFCNISGGSLDHAPPKMAGDFVPTADRFQGRSLRPAFRLGEPAPRVTATTPRWMLRARNLAWHQQPVLPPFPGIRLRR